MTTIQLFQIKKTHNRVFKLFIKIALILTVKNYITLYFGFKIELYIRYQPIHKI